MAKKNRPLKRLLLVTSCCLFLVFLLAVRPIVRSTLAILGLSLGESKLPIRVCRDLFAYKIDVTETEIPGVTHPIRLRVLSPRGVSSPPVVIMVHGFVEQGIDNAHLMGASQLLAASGLRVVLPEIQSERLLLMRKAGVDDVESTIDWSARTYGKRVSVLGASFSGALVLTAATRPHVSDELKIVGVISGYNSVFRLSKYYLDNPAAGPDGAAYVGPRPGIGPLLIALQYIDQLLPADDREPVSAALRNVAFREDTSIAGKALVQSLSARQRHEYEMLSSFSAVQAKPLIEAQLATDARQMSDISPAGGLQNVQCPVYILHGLNDTVIPAGEARWNLAGLRLRTEVHTLISPGLAHAEVDITSRRRERVKVGLFIWRLILAMQAKHGTVPLFV